MDMTLALCLSSSFRPARCRNNLRRSGMKFTCDSRSPKKACAAHDTVERTMDAWMDGWTYSLLDRATHTAHVCAFRSCSLSLSTREADIGR